jgi:hypothetical protein
MSRVQKRLKIRPQDGLGREFWYSWWQIAFDKAYDLGNPRSKEALIKVPVVLKHLAKCRFEGIPGRILKKVCKGRQLHLSEHYRSKEENKK